MANNSNRLEMQYTNKHSTETLVYKPIIKVSFHTKDRLYDLHALEKNSADETVNPNHHVLSVNTNKTLEAPAGSFTITLAGSQWSTRITSNDMVVIQMGYMGQKTTTVMVGLVDNVSRRRMMSSDGTPTVNTTVTGRDFGKLFVKDVLKFYPQLNNPSKQAKDNFFLTDVGWVNLMKVFTADSIMKGTPAVILDNIMRFIFTKYNDTKWTVYSPKSKTKKTGVTASQVIRYSFGKINFFLPFIMTADQFEGSLWNMMERASIKPFTELFIDVRSVSELSSSKEEGRVVPHTIEQSSNQAKGKLHRDKGNYPYPGVTFGEDQAKVMLVLRETPFDTTLRKKLATHTIKEIDVLSEDLSRNDNEHYNLFWAGTTVNPLGIDLKRVCPPLFNQDNAERYGLSPLEVEIEGLEILESKANAHMKTLEGLTKTYTAKLKSWYQNNHLYWNGDIEIKGKANIRVGQRVIYDVTGFKYEFYVEAVSQSWNTFENWTTHLTLTRGMKVEEPVKPKPPAKPTTPPKQPTKPSTPAKPKDKYHVVRAGETLQSIAKRYYGDYDYDKIWEANKKMLIARDKRNSKDKAHWIYPGQKLRIPPE